MGTTVGGLPYPEPTDPIAQGAAAIRALAEAIDLTQWEPWTSFPVATGWSVGTSQLQRTRDGKWVRMRGSITRTGADITSGGVSVVFTLAAGFRPAIWTRVPFHHRRTRGRRVYKSNRPASEPCRRLARSSSQADMSTSTV